MKFTKDFLIRELELPWEAKEDRVIDNDRWTISHEIIFEYEGKYYLTYYRVGATELQDERPWEYQTEIECTEVHQVPRTILCWEPVAK